MMGAGQNNGSSVMGLGEMDRQLRKLVREGSEAYAVNSETESG